MASSEPTYTEDELREIEESAQNKNTAKKNKAAEKKLCKHLHKKWSYPLNVDLRSISYKRFNEILRHLWFETRQLNGQKYRASSLENLFHSINRILKQHDFEDMNKSMKWQRCNEAFKNAVCQLKQNGLGYIENTPEIISEGLFNLKHSLAFLLSKTSLNMMKNSRSSSMKCVQTQCWKILMLACSNNSAFVYKQKSADQTQIIFTYPLKELFVIYRSHQNLQE